MILASAHSPPLVLASSGLCPCHCLYSPTPPYLSLSLAVSISFCLFLWDSFLLSASLTLVFLLPLSLSFFSPSSSLPSFLLLFQPPNFLSLSPIPGLRMSLAHSQQDRGRDSPSALSPLRPRAAGPSPLPFSLAYLQDWDICAHGNRATETDTSGYWDLNYSNCNTAPKLSSSPAWGAGGHRDAGVRICKSLGLRM